MRLVAATAPITLTGERAKELQLPGKHIFSIDAENKAKFQIDSKFSMFKNSFGIFSTSAIKVTEDPLPKGNPVK